MRFFVLFFICCFALCGVQFAFAGWGNTHWGMAVQEVEKAVGVPLQAIEAKPNQYGNLSFPYNGDTAGLVCSIPAKGLERVGLAFTGETPCMRQYISLLESYGKPLKLTEDGGKMKTAEWSEGDSRIQFMWGKGLGGNIDSMCSVTYSPAQ